MNLAKLYGIPNIILFAVLLIPLPPNYNSKSLNSTLIQKIKMIRLLLLPILKCHFRAAVLRRTSRWLLGTC
jgi:hypothetical protein